MMDMAPGVRPRAILLQKTLLSLHGIAIVSACIAAGFILGTDLSKALQACDPSKLPSIGVIFLAIYIWHVTLIIDVGLLFGLKLGQRFTMMVFWLLHWLNVVMSSLWVIWNEVSRFNNFRNTWKDYALLALNLLFLILGSLVKRMIQKDSRSIETHDRPPMEIQERPAIEILDRPAIEILDRPAIEIQDRQSNA